MKWSYKIPLLGFCAIKGCLVVKRLYTFKDFSLYNRLSHLNKIMPILATDQIDTDYMQLTNDRLAFNQGYPNKLTIITVILSGPP